jgi:4-hydroxybenzoate polyprenyltransferase
LSLHGLLVELRPRQWTKNLVLFAGLVFSKSATDPALAVRSLLGFVCFCLASGAVYIINDIADREQDRLHPVKRNRPIAAGVLKPSVAAAWAIVLIIATTVLAFILGGSFFVVFLIFLALNLFYSFKLKQIMGLDVLAIAVGFVLRAIAGVDVLAKAEPGIELSPWLLVCTLFLALFLGLGKRRAELAQLDEDAQRHRKSLANYSIGLLNQMIAMVSAATVISYSIYTISPGTVQKFHTEKLVYTIPFVVYGLWRYLYLVSEREGGGNPSEVLLTDAPLLVTVLLWVLVAAGVLYLS